MNSAIPRFKVLVAKILYEKKGREWEREKEEGRDGKKEEKEKKRKKKKKKKKKEKEGKEEKEEKEEKRGKLTLVSSSLQLLVVGSLLHDIKNLEGELRGGEGESFGVNVVLEKKKRKKKEKRERKRIELKGREGGRGGKEKINKQSF